MFPCVIASQVLHGLKLPTLATLEMGHVAKTVAVVLRNNCECFLLDDCNPGLFLVSKRVIKIAIINTNAPHFPRFDGVRIDAKSALVSQVYISVGFSLPKARTFSMIVCGSASHAAGSRLPLMWRTVKGGNQWR